GIQYLVSSAVEGLEADKVAVLDDRGKMLNRPSDTSTAGSGELLDLKRKMETDLEERIEQILSRVVGTAKVIAKVDATLNHRLVTAVEESVDPEKTAVRSQQTEEESLGGSRTNPAGVPGARANLPGAEDAGQVGFRQDVKKELKTINYDVPKTVRNIRETAGGLERLSVAVVVDGLTQTTKKEDGTEETKWVSRSAEDLAKYETLIKNTVGFSANRGDSVKIESMQFVPEDFTEAALLLNDLKRKQILHFIFQWGLVLFGLVLFFFVVARPFMQWITDSFRDSVDDMLPRTLEELEQLQAVDNTLPGMSAALPVLEQAIDPDKAESELLKDRINTIMSQDEEKVANAFGMWLVRRDQ
ncbi:MAG: flagellar basal-body MS-ring/collar protein FliF, partial [Bdellovibrio sp.]